MKNQIFGLLLAFLFAIFILPTNNIVLANLYPTDHVNLFFKNSLGEDKYVILDKYKPCFKNGVAVEHAILDGVNCTAFFNADKGEVWLQGFRGRLINVTGQGYRDLTIRLEDNNNIIEGNGSRSGLISNSTKGNIRITTAENKSGSLTLNSTDEGSTGIGCSGSISIDGNAQVNVNVNYRGINKEESTRGISGSNGVSIKDNASVNIISKNHQSVNAGFSYGIYSNSSDININTSGKIIIETNVPNAPNKFSYSFYANKKLIVDKAKEMQFTWGANGKISASTDPMLINEDDYIITSQTLPNQNKKTYKLKEIISGMVIATPQIQPRYGDTLTANTNIPAANPGDVVYEWLRDETVVATGRNYTLDIPDIGNVMIVRVKAANLRGFLVSKPTAIVEKALFDGNIYDYDGAEIWEEEITNEKIVFEGGAGQGSEYAIKKATSSVGINELRWVPYKSAPMKFTGLDSGTEYIIYARFSETDTHLPSDVLEKEVSTKCKLTISTNGIIADIHSYHYKNDVVKVSAPNINEMNFVNWSSEDGVDFRGGSEDISTEFYMPVWDTTITANYTSPNPYLEINQVNHNTNYIIMVTPHHIEPGTKIIEANYKNNVLVSIKFHNYNSKPLLFTKGIGTGRFKFFIWDKGKIKPLTNTVEAEV